MVTVPCPDAARFLRQLLLPEIGEAGQARIVATRARVGGDGLAGEVASRYARAAGFAGVDPAPLDLDALAPVALCVSPTARAVLGGARAALGELRRAAEVTA